MKVLTGRDGCLGTRVLPDDDESSNSDMPSMLTAIDGGAVDVAFQQADAFVVLAGASEVRVPTFEPRRAEASLPTIRRCSPSRVAEP